MVTRLGRATDGPIPTRGNRQCRAPGSPAPSQGARPALEALDTTLFSPPQQCSKSNGFVQIGCTLCTLHLNSEHYERGGSIRGDREGGAGGRGRESKSGREKCASRRKRSAARARAGGEKGCEKKTEPDVWARTVLHGLGPGGRARVTATRSASSFCRAAGPAAAAADDPVPRTLPSGTRWPSHHAPPAA